MCLILAKPEGITFPRIDVEDAYHCNRDSIGMAFATGDRVHVQHWIRPNAATHEQILDKCERLKDYPLLLHYRLATHGDVSKLNAHPFKRYGCAIAHNGIIPGYGDRRLSDTAHFLNKHVKSLDDVLTLEQFAEPIGSSKLCALLPEGTFKYANREYGTDHTDGCWYSNRHHVYTGYETYKWNSGHVIDACDTFRFDSTLARYAPEVYFEFQDVDMFPIDAWQWKSIERLIIQCRRDNATEKIDKVYMGGTSGAYLDVWIELDPKDMFRVWYYSDQTRTWWRLAHGMLID